ncbi:unnamed protein product [Urochloa humidicola]
MACSVAPALPDEMFRQAGTAPHQMMSKARHRRTGAVFAGTDDEVAEVLRPVVPDSTCLDAPPEETPLTDLDWIGYLGTGKGRHRRTAAVFAGTDDEVAEVLRRPVVGALEAEVDLPAMEEPWFPTGVLGGPPESFVSSGPEMTAAFLVSLVAAGAGTSESATRRRTVSFLWPAGRRGSRPARAARATSGTTVPSKGRRRRRTRRVCRKRRRRCRKSPMKTRRRQRHHRG